MYVPRFIEPTVGDLLKTTPVVILEGARSVGKTRLLARLLELGTVHRVVSLIDPTARAAATEDPALWLRSLGDSFAVDEAQLAPGLPLALKQRLDRETERLRCVLTGSASLGRTGLGGSDPLARRSVRLTLEPLSEAELGGSGRSWSVIEQLFGGEPISGASAATDWRVAAERGGLPRYRLLAHDLRPRQVLDDIEAIITDDVLPGERFDRRIAIDVARHVLRNPAGELKVVAIANELGIDARTVNRYLDVLERRFLVTELPNLRQPLKQSARSTAKAYPADVALSTAYATASGRQLDHEQVRGGVFEALIAQQLRAHLGWTEAGGELVHWRQLRSGRYVEVDLAVVDAAGGLVGIEVKARESAKAADFAGLRQLRQMHRARFRRGFVVTTGGSAAQFDDEMWAVPFAALGDPAWWGLPRPAEMSELPYASAPPSSPVANGAPVARLVAYLAPADLQSAVAGDPRQFARDIADGLEGLHGRRVTLVEDDDATPADMPDESHGQAPTLVLVFITPRFLSDKACRAEFTRLIDEAVRTEGLVVRPLIWITPRNLTMPEGDSLVDRLGPLRPTDVSEARRAERDSVTYRALIEDVANELDVMWPNGRA